MLTVDDYGKIRRAHRDGMSIRDIANWRLSQAPDFERRVHAFLVAHAVTVVRLHCGGDFYSAGYARKWLRVVHRERRVRFCFYTRAWRDGSIRPVLERMARLDNCRAWYSCDAQTGVPGHVTPRVRLAWLATGPDDLPPAQANLVFRIWRLRRQPATQINGVRVCPAEDGLPHGERITCERCSLCWRPLDQGSEAGPQGPADGPSRVPLPLSP